MTTRDHRARPLGSAVFVHRVARCSYTASRGVHCRGQLITGDHLKYRQKTPIAVVIFSEHVKVNRGDGCSNEGCALAVLFNNLRIAIALRSKTMKTITMYQLLMAITTYKESTLYIINVRVICAY